NDVVGPGVDPARMRAPESSLEFFNMRGYRPLASPGQGTSYSAANATLLGIVLETAAGQPLNDLMTARVFGPAGVMAGFASFGGRMPTVHNYIDLRDTLVDVGDGPMAVPGREFVYDLSAIDPSWAWATGVCLDVAALARLMDQMIAWMTDGAGATGPMMGPHGPEVMDPHGGAIRFGLGQIQRETPAGPAIGYDGQGLGYAALVYAVPESDLTVAILANGSGRDVNLPQMFARVVALVAERGEGLF
ncbi:MAG: serine hydrolase, partial [Proteobacteria bacterium]|nr:serine hydrolase [Pseudomonadota bacterium]